MKNITKASTKDLANAVKFRRGKQERSPILNMGKFQKHLIALSRFFMPEISGISIIG